METTGSKSLQVQNECINALKEIPGVGKSIAADLFNIGIRKIVDLEGQDPEDLYDRSNQYAGCVQDRCLLYVFRCAVYYAETPKIKARQSKIKVVELEKFVNTF